MLISVIAVIVVFSMLILSHELGHFIMAKKMGVRVEVFSLGFGPKIWSAKKGDTVYTVCAIPLGGYVKMAGEEPGEVKGEEWEFFSKPVYKRFNIVTAGSIFNYLLGLILFCIIFMVGVPLPTSRVGEILEGYPAEKAGIMVNDRILEIDGEPVEYWDDVLSSLHSKKEGDATEILVNRGGEEIVFSLSGKTTEQKDIFGKPVKITLIGIAPSEESEIVKYGFFKSIDMGVRKTWGVTALTYKLIWYLVTGAMPIKGAAAGPIGIVAITSQAARMGILYLLNISALISISLAIFNLLPVPPLDGGHILFLAIEKLKGRPINRKVQEIAQQTGWILLITLLLFVSWNDILRFFK